MHRRGEKLILSATDLVGFLHCGHLTNLEIAAVNGQIHRPSQREDPEVLLLQRRGAAHEQRYIEQLEAEGRTVTKLEADWNRSYEERAAETEALMRVLNSPSPVGSRTDPPEPSVSGTTPASSPDGNSASTATATGVLPLTMPYFASMLISPTSVNDSEFSYPALRRTGARRTAVS